MTESDVDEDLGQPALVPKSSANDDKDKDNRSKEEASKIVSGSTVSDERTDKAEAATSKVTERATTEELEKEAEDLIKFASTDQVNDISDSSLICWYKNKKALHPVCIRTNHDEALNLATSKFTKMNDTLVRFIGFRRQSVGTLAVVSSKSLHPFYAHHPDAKIKNDQDNLDKTQWSPTMMETFEKSMDTGQNKKTPVERRAEILQLERLLKYVLDREKEKNEANNNASDVKKEETQGDEKSEEDLQTNKETNGDNVNVNTSEAKDDDVGDGVDKESNQTNLDKEGQDDATKLEQTDKEGGQRKRFKKPAVKPQAIPQSNTTETIKFVKKVRAGDCIKYYIPGSVACKETERESLVLRVTPSAKGDQIALDLEDGTKLPRSQIIVLKQRFFRDTLRLVEGPQKWMSLEEFALDASNNEKYEEVKSTLAKSAEQIQKEAKQAADAFWSKTNAKEGSEGNEKNQQEGTGTQRAAKRPSEINIAKPLSPKRTKAAPSMKSKPAEKKKTAEKTAPPSMQKKSKILWEADNGKQASPKKRKLDVDAPASQTSSSTEIIDKRIPFVKDLDKKIEELEKKKKNRRSNVDSIATRMKHLHTVKLAWKALLSIARNRDDIKNLDMLLIEMEEKFDHDDVGVETLWQFLDGNANELLSDEKLKTQTELWVKWLESAQAKAAIAQAAIAKADSIKQEQPNDSMPKLAKGAKPETKVGQKGTVNASSKKKSTNAEDDAVKDPERSWKVEKTDLEDLFIKIAEEEKIVHARKEAVKTALSVCEHVGTLDNSSITKLSKHLGVPVGKLKRYFKGSALPLQSLHEYSKALDDWVSKIENATNGNQGFAASGALEPVGKNDEKATFSDAEKKLEPLQSTSATETRGDAKGLANDGEKVSSKNDGDKVSSSASAGAGVNDHESSSSPPKPSSTASAEAGTNSNGSMNTKDKVSSTISGVTEVKGKKATTANETAPSTTSANAETKAVGSNPADEKASFKTSGETGDGARESNAEKKVSSS